MAYSDDFGVVPASQPSVLKESLPGGYIGLAIVNLLLTIVTLGIYRFWAKTRPRRFLWSHLNFAGEPLEYRGRGIELFVGALLGFAIILVPLFLLQLVQQALRAGGQPVVAGLLQIPLVGGFFYLVGVGQYRAERYMLSRTAWRSIRGGMIKGGWRYGWLRLKLMLLQIVTLNLTSPYVTTRLWNARMGDAMFGSVAVQAHVEWKLLFKRYLIAYIGVIVVYGIAVALIFGSIMQLVAIQQHAGAPARIDPRILLPLVGRIYGFLIAATVIAALLMLSYQAAFWRQAVGNTKLGTLGSAFTATTTDWLKYYIGKHPAGRANAGAGHCHHAVAGLGVLYAAFENGGCAGHQHTAANKFGDTDPGRGHGRRARVQPDAVLTQGRRCAF